MICRRRRMVRGTTLGRPRDPASGANVPADEPGRYSRSASNVWIALSTSADVLSGPKT